MLQKSNSLKELSQDTTWDKATPGRSNHIPESRAFIWENQRVLGYLKKARPKNFTLPSHANRREFILQRIITHQRNKKKSKQLHLPDFIQTTEWQRKRCPSVWPRRHQSPTCHVDLSSEKETSIHHINSKCPGLSKSDSHINQLRILVFNCRLFIPRQLLITNLGASEVSER